MTEFADKAKTIGAPRRWGQKKRTKVQRDDDGTHAGLQIEHWDDRVDAVVRPRTIAVKPVVERIGGAKTHVIPEEE
jgi:hypothetical protein